MPSLDSSFKFHRSSFGCARFARARGYTLVEFFLTIAVLVVVLGLMIKLADRIRTESCDRLTRQTLHQLAVAMGQYIDQNHQLPQVTALVEGAVIPVDQLKSLARQNNAEVVRCLHLNTPDGLVQDAWGTPIVFMPHQHPAIGMAPGDKPFFLSAGQDRLFQTREDNLYSYEEGQGNE